MVNNKTISILGCGWYGLALAKHLVSKGYQVKGSTTNTEKLDLFKKEGITPYCVNFTEDQQSYQPEFFDSETLIIAIPPKRHSGEQASYAKKVAAISEAARKGAVMNVLFISSTAVYSNSNEEVNESTPPTPETDSGKAILASENLLEAQQAFKATILRFAGLVGPGRDPGRFFAGKQQVPNGLSPVNLIHLHDCIHLTEQILIQNHFGYVVNGCTPHHPVKMDFYTKAAIRSGFSEPSFVKELKEWKIITSNQTPTILNYKYLINNWTDWLAQDKL